MSPLDDDVEFDVRGPHSLLVLAIGRSVVDAIDRDSTLDCADVLNEGHHCYHRDSRVEALMHRVRDALRGDGPVREPLLEGLPRALVASLVETIAGTAHAPSGGGPPIRVDLLEEYVRANVTGRITLDRLAAAISADPASFPRRFREQVGVPPYEFVQRVRVQLATSLLGDPTVHLSDIASMVGYADQSHFGRAFRERTGRTPRQYRALPHDGARPGDGVRSP